MKILHALDIPWWSGLSAYAVESAEHHLALGHQVFLAVPAQSLAASHARKAGLPTVDIFDRKRLWGIANFFSLFGAIFKLRPQVVVVHTGSLHLSAAIICWLSGSRLIRTRATAQKLKVHFLNRCLYQSTDKIVTASRHLQDSLSRITAANVETIYPAVKTHDFSGSEPPLSVGFLARLDPVKGHAWFLKAARWVEDQGIFPEWHFAGSEENIRWSEVRRQAKMLGLKNIVYHGFIDNSRVSGWMQNKTIGVLASIASEEVARALLEWMACGKPVVATTVGSIPEILGGEFCVKPFAAEEFAAKMTALLKDKKMAAKTGQAHQEKVQKEFSPQAAQQAWKKILESPSFSSSRKPG